MMVAHIVIRAIVLYSACVMLKLCYFSYPQMMHFHSWLELRWGVLLCHLSPTLLTVYQLC